MVDYDDMPVRPSRPTGPPLWTVGLIGLPFLLFLFGAVLWFVVRVEVDANEIMALVKKSGRPIPKNLADEFADQVVLYPALVDAIAAETGLDPEAVATRYKGIQYKVFGPGRYFPNPYSYRAKKMRATIIGENEIGVLIRKYGKPLPFPKTVATEPDERGPVAEILRPGRHNINLLAYDIQRFPAIQIPEGRVGVVTLLSGKDPAVKNTYTVEPGEKGVQREIRPSGLEYYNPYLEQIEIVDVRSHKYDMLGEDAIHFPSNDSFTITIEGTIEWAIRPDKVADVTVAYGDEQDILSKIILPNARSISRIQGSKLRARDFISGKTRTAFQVNLLDELRHECWKQGIDIKSALVRGIQPPAEIAALISQREQADQEIDRSTNEMEEAKSEVKLVEQRELQARNEGIGNARRDVVTMTKKSDQERVIAVTRANRELEVAKLALQAAEKEAAATVSRGEAEANVVLFEYQARAEPLASAVQAFGDGETYAQQFFLQKVAPAVKSIMSNTEGPFADIFKQLQSAGATGRNASQQGGGQ